MTIWILHQTLSAEEETQIQERTHLILPFDGLPDLSRVRSEAACRHLMRTLHPDEPPETITRRVDKLWQYYNGLQVEDVIAVPLWERKEMALAEIIGPYDYAVGEGGTDVHRIPVRWYPKSVPFSAFRKHRDLLDNTGRPLFAVTHVEARTIIRDRLPHAYNRFVKVKWLLVVFFIMGGLRLLHRM